MSTAPAPAPSPAPAPAPAQPPAPSVALSLQAWEVIDETLAGLPFRRAAPIYDLLNRTGGVRRVVTAPTAP